MENLESLSDKELYQLCQTYGANIRMLTKKFAVLLPEVEKRQLYKKYGFHSIFEFAGRIAGMRRETVVDILRVSRKIEDKPHLKEIMEEHGWGKVKVVAGIANLENEKMLAEKVKEMSKPTLITFVNEIKKQNDGFVQNRTGSASRFHTDSEESSNRQGQSSRIFLRLLLEPKVDLRFRELQKKLSKQAKGPVDFNEVLKTLLDVYDGAVQNGKKQKEDTTRYGPDMENAEAQQVKLETMKNEVNEILKKRPAGCRYIPAKEKQFLYQKYAGRCAFPECMKLPEIFHHTRRFALNPSHDPDFIVPLCKEHERLAHLGLIENEEKPPEEWRLRMEREKMDEKYAVDRKVNEFRTLFPPS